MTRQGLDYGFLTRASALSRSLALSPSRSLALALSLPPALSPSHTRARAHLVADGHEARDAIGVAPADQSRPSRLQQELDSLRVAALRW